MIQAFAFLVAVLSPVDPAGLSADSFELREWSSQRLRGSWWRHPVALAVSLTGDVEGRRRAAQLAGEWYADPVGYTVALVFVGHPAEWRTTHTRTVPGAWGFPLVERWHDGEWFERDTSRLMQLERAVIWLGVWNPEDKTDGITSWNADKVPGLILSWVRADEACAFANVMSRRVKGRPFPYPTDPKGPRPMPARP